MNKEKFEYFLNAVHYCLWLGEKRMGTYARKLVDFIFSPIPKYLFTTKYRRQYYVNLADGRKQVDALFNEKKGGVRVGIAHHWFGYFYSGYPIILSFILVGIALKYDSNVSGFTKLFIMAIPIGICYIPAYKAVFSGDKYLKYFKMFQKEDEQWHKKWKRITIAFCIGSVISTIIGIGAIWGVLLL